MIPTYPYLIEPDNNGFLIRFPDIPEALTSVDDKKSIPGEALDCLVTALAGYALEGRPWPKARASRTDGHAITLPALLVAKLELTAEMHSAGLTKSALARKLRLDEKAVRRLLDLNHRSHIDQIEEALKALGKQVEIRVKAA
jgi:antitoxin HicB